MLDIVTKELLLELPFCNSKDPGLSGSRVLSHMMRKSGGAMSTYMHTVFLIIFFRCKVVCVFLPFL